MDCNRICQRPAALVFSNSLTLFLRSFLTWKLHSAARQDRSVLGCLKGPAVPEEEREGVSGKNEDTQTY